MMSNLAINIQGNLGCFGTIGELPSLFQKGKNWSSIHDKELPSDCFASFQDKLCACYMVIRISDQYLVFSISLVELKTQIKNIPVFLFILD